MILSLACSLLAFFAPMSPPEEPRQPKVVDKPVEAVFGYTTPAHGQASVYEWSNAVPLNGNFVLASDGPSLTLEPLDDATRAQLPAMNGRGLVASSVREGGPAWEAGIRPQDVLTSLNSQPLSDPIDLDRLLKKAGDEPVTLTLLRKRKPVELKVRSQVHVELGPVGDDEPKHWIGASVEAIPAALRAQLELPEDRGLAVSRLVEDAPAAKAGLKVHDVVLTIDGAPIADGPAMIERVSKAGDKPLTLEILRAGERRTVTVTAEKRPTLDQVGMENRVRVWQSPGVKTKFVDVFRPGAVVGSDADGFQVKVFDSKLQDVPADTAAEARKDRIEAEIKALRDAVESLRKALEAKK
ncbi:PDZ domain-containing protein [Paludisphaera rhizosphaerae]|uniref:PDZ domain-containing protein n=1 Tax=Paludisphaera rhizosphaerae TaxID=2711216 RepID=UPI0013EB6B9A|nr:PDZ domain-containing protein [Paludisphaera rhizosphaerae]